MFYKKMVFQFCYGIMGTIMNNKIIGRCLKWSCTHSFNLIKKTLIGQTVVCIHISHFCLVVIIIIFFYIKCLPSCNINLLLWFIFMINLNGRVNDLYNPYMASASAGSFLQVIPVQQQGLRRGLKIVKCNTTLRALLCYVLYWYRCSYTLLCARTCVES